VDERRIAEAEMALDRLFGERGLVGASFLDIGCGSGLHALAALRRGARSVMAVDIDPQSVAASRRTLATDEPAGRWHVEVASVFDLDPRRTGRFDVVYSWGVLHHTGAMWESIHHASTMVADEGHLALALYRKTPLCRLWAAEKQIYISLPPPLQRLVRLTYVAIFRIAHLLRGTDFAAYVRDYPARRGMDFYHDVHDWLGGWPYESVRASELRSFVARLGFEVEREFVRAPGWGIFGSGNDEFVFRRSKGLPDPSLWPVPS
jgi:SAM-dependent methyltransferase